MEPVEPEWADRLLAEIEGQPTVEAGIVVAVAHIRWAIEEQNRELDNPALRKLTVALSDRAADIADAIVSNTPTEAVSRTYAQVVQEADAAAGRSE